jgi:thiol-disulfide isomerase/thioredoxin
MKDILFTGILMATLAITAHAQQLPEFSIQDIENNIQTFDDLKGDQLTLFDFWATWCKPCRKAIPELNTIYDAYKNKGVQIVGVNCDGPRSQAKVAPAVRSLQIQYPVLLDINADLMNELNLVNLPTLIAVDPGGKVVYVHEGFALGDEVEIKAAIDDLIRE